MAKIARKSDFGPFFLMVVIELKRKSRQDKTSTLTFLIQENKEESRSGNYLQMENMLITRVKDTANPFTHHVMASSNCFNQKQALAPKTDKKS